MGVTMEDLLHITLTEREFGCVAAALVHARSDPRTDQQDRVTLEGRLAVEVEQQIPKPEEGP